jgi:outer membrane protein assembly factor BamB
MRTPRNRTGASILAAAVLVLTTVDAQQLPTDYPQWRGKTRDGAASAFIAPQRWPERLMRRWRAEVGAGYATPIIVGDRVYVFARRRDDDVMLCLNAETGDLIWETRYPAPYAPGKPAATHGAGPKATPTYHLGRLFSLSASGILAAFDAATGKLLWKTAAPSEAPYFNAASSPVADGALVFAHPGNYGPLTAYDAATGRVSWTAGGDGFFASPTIATLAGTRQILTVTQTRVIGVSLDGAVLWQYAWAGGAGGTMPILWGDTVIVSGLDQGTHAFIPAFRDGKWIVDPQWRTSDVSMYLSNPVVVGDTLFGLSHKQSGQYFALDLKTGSILWRGAPRQAFNTAVVSAGDLLFLLNDDAELILARASKTAFEPIVQYTVAETATWAQPAITGERIFVRDLTAVTLWTLR